MNKLQKEMHDLWESRRPELESLTKSLGMCKLAAYYGVNTKTMRRRLEQMGLIATPRAGRWLRIIDRVREQAKTMTARELSAHYKVREAVIRDVLTKHKITAKKELGMREISQNQLGEFIKLATNLTNPQLANHYDCSIGTILHYRRINGLIGKDSPIAGFWESRRELLKDMASKMSSQEMSDQFGIKAGRMRMILADMGIKVAYRKPKKVRAARKRAYVKKIKAPKLKPIAMNREIPLVKKQSVPVKTTVEKIVIVPETVKVKVYERPKSSDPRCVMAAPVWNPSKRNFLGNYV